MEEDQDKTSDVTAESLGIPVRDIQRMVQAITGGSTMSIVARAFSDTTRLQNQMAPSFMSISRQLLGSPVHRSIADAIKPSAGFAAALSGTASMQSQTASLVPKLNGFAAGLGSGLLAMRSAAESMSSGINSLLDRIKGIREGMIARLASLTHVPLFKIFSRPILPNLLSPLREMSSWMAFKAPPVFSSIQTLLGNATSTLTSFARSVGSSFDWLREWAELWSSGYYLVRGAARDDEFHIKALAAAWVGTWFLYKEVNAMNDGEFTKSELRQLYRAKVRQFCWVVAESGQYPELPKKRFARVAHRLLREEIQEEFDQVAHDHFEEHMGTVKIDGEPHILARDAAKIAKRHQSTITRYLRTGKLPGQQRRWYFKSKRAYNDKTWFLPYNPETIRKLESLNPDESRVPSQLKTSAEVAVELGSSERNIRRLDKKLSTPPLFTGRKKSYSSNQVEELRMLLEERESRRLGNLKPKPAVA